MIQFIAGAAGAGLLLGSLGAWYFTAEYKDAEWGAAVNELKIEASNTLLAETNRVRVVERDSQNRVRELEQQYETTTDQLQAYERTNRDLVVKLGGLRDTGRRASRTNTVPSTTSKTTSTPVTPACEAGILSTESTEALLTDYALADQVSTYATLAYEWSLEVDKVYVLPEKE